MKNIKLKINIKDPIQAHQERLRLFLSNDPMLNRDNEFILNHGAVLKKDLTTGIISNELKNIIDNDKKNFKLLGPLFSIREFYIKNFGFSLLTESYIENLSQHLKDKNVVDIGAGTGLLANTLYEKGINIKAIDEHDSHDNPYEFISNYFPILKDNGVDYLKSVGELFDTVILSWPNYDTSFADDILKSMHIGQELIYIGEGYGGCTADENFWDTIKQRTSLDKIATNFLEKDYLSFPSIHDEPYVFKVIK